MANNGAGGRRAGRSADPTRVRLAAGSTDRDGLASLNPHFTPLPSISRTRELLLV